MPGDLTTPVGRTVTAAEADELRRQVWRNLRLGWGRTLARYATLAGIFGVAGAIEWWLDDERRWDRAVLAQALVFGIFALIAIAQTRRLLSLPGLDTLEVHRVLSPVYDGYARLFTPSGYRRVNLFSWSYRLYPLPGRVVGPHVVWRLDLVRVRHGGPEQYFVLAATAVRPVTGQERRDMDSYLWKTGVYQRPD
jgi:hypothetical protein